MRSNGPSVRLGDLIEVKHGWPFKSELFSEEKTGKGIVVAIGNFRYTGGFRFSETATKEYRGTYPEEYELSPGDILLVMTCQTAGGEILGIPAKVPDDRQIYLHNQRLGKVVLKSDAVLPGFLYWLFLSPDFNRSLVSSASGTKILHTSPTRICDFRFDLPSIERQHDIAEALDALQGRIDLLRQTNITLESIAQALFKSWFIDFDPVRAKAAGCEPEGMDAATAELFPAEFEESALGLIPKGWDVRSLDSFATYLNGLALQKYPPESEDEYLPVIKIAQLRAGNTVGADKASARLKPEYVVRDGDVLFSWSGSLEVEFWCGGDGALNQHLFKVSSSEVPKWFYYLATKHFLPVFREIAAHKATTMGHIQRGHLKDARLAMPSSNVLEALSSLMRPLLERRVSGALLARELAAVRDALLPRLISGKLRPSEVKEQVQEALA